MDFFRIGFLSGILLLAGLWLSCFCPGELHAAHLASLQSYTGLWNMPTARVLPDWNIRLGYGWADPYRYYGGAIGLFDRLEISGQFTEITSITAFEDYDYGNYKDRAAGMRLVLFKEDELFPQVALGAFDATGTALFSQRYLVASKRFGKADITLGLGQGTLAGEYTSIGGSQDAAGTFLFSSPNRPTRPFGGIEYDLTPNWTLSAEYSSLDRKNLYGYRDGEGQSVYDGDNGFWPVNIGLKYHSSNWQANLAVLRGDTLAAGVQMAFPLKLDSLLGWRRTPELDPGASLLYRAATSENEGLAILLADQLTLQGFDGVKVASSDTSVWVEFSNNRHLEVMRSFGHIANTLDKLLPSRITTFYLNQTEHDLVIQSLKLPRESFHAFMDERLDQRTLQSFSDMDLSAGTHWDEFQKYNPGSRLQEAPEKRFSYQIQPRIFTFLNNKAGFFKHKGVLELTGGVRLWRGARLAAGGELVLFNQYDDLDWEPLEDNAVRTDMVEYQRRSDPSITQLAFEQYGELPGQWQGRLAVGMFERAYAGFGLETFRFFHNGLWGVGFEAEAVRKRDLDNSFKLRNDPGMDDWFYTGFVNLYAQLWPSQGVEVGLKVGRFLAGDPGVSIELRRSFKHFTVGAWYTKTDTSLFNDPENIDSETKGVFIRFPLALFKDRDVPGHLHYAITSFTTDQGQTVAQPGTLYPMDPWDTPVQSMRDLNKMRQY